MDQQADSPPNVVRTLWHGEVSVYEELSLLSFLQHGHEVELYSYQPVAVPDGVKLCDANEILPEAQIFSYSQGPAKGSFAAFSNLFRLKLLYERGGIYSDADMLCLRPLHSLPDGTVGRDRDKWLNGAFMKFSPGHPVCEELYRMAEELGSGIRLGQTAEMVTEVVTRNQDICNILPSSAFYPIPWHEAWKLVDPDELEYCTSRTPESYCVHYWNTAITFAIQIPKSALPPKGSYLHTMAEPIFRGKIPEAWPIDRVKPLFINLKRLAEADTALDAGDWGKAAELLEAVVTTSNSPQPPATWVKLVKACRKMPQLEKAERAAQEALARFPGEVALLQELGDIALDRQEWSRAAEIFGQIRTKLGESTPPRNLARLSRALRRSGNLRAAEAIVQEGLQRFPQEDSLQKELSSIQKKQRPSARKTEDAEIYFYVPSPKLIREIPDRIGAYWPWITEAVHRHPVILPEGTEYAGRKCTWGGPYNWTLQPYLHLHAAGFPCKLTATLPKRGIIIAHSDFLPRGLQPTRDQFVVELKPDRQLQCTHAHYVIVQNELDPLLAGRDRHFIAASYVRYWPQPGLLPRDSKRGARFEHVSYMGDPRQFACDPSKLSERIHSLGLTFDMPPRNKWHDYSQVDAVVAVRPGASETEDQAGVPVDFSLIRKPASKLINAWLAGVPAILSDEDAYRRVRKSDLDYLEANTLDQVVQRLDQLARDPDLRRKMSENGLRRAAEFSAEATAKMWMEILNQQVIPRYCKWRKSGIHRAAFRIVRGIASRVSPEFSQGTAGAHRKGL